MIDRFHISHFLWYINNGGMRSCIVIENNDSWRQQARWIDRLMQIFECLDVHWALLNYSLNILLGQVFNHTSHLRHYVMHLKMMQMHNSRILHMRHIFSFTLTSTFQNWNVNSSYGAFQTNFIWTCLINYFMKTNSFFSIKFTKNQLSLHWMVSAIIQLL